MKSYIPILYYYHKSSASSDFFHFYYYFQQCIINVCTLFFYKIALQDVPGPRPQARVYFKKQAHRNMVEQQRRSAQFLSEDRHTILAQCPLNSGHAIFHAKWWRQQQNYYRTATQYYGRLRKVLTALITMPHGAESNTFAVENHLILFEN